MELKELQKKVDDLTLNLIAEGILDYQFKQLQLLQEDNMPDFVFDIVSNYLTDFEKIINDMHSVFSLKRKKMDNCVKHNEDLSKVDEYAFQLKGASKSIGAKRVIKSCEDILKCCKENNHKGCTEGLKQLKQEYSLLKTKIEPLLSLEQEISVLNETIKALEGNN